MKVTFVGTSHGVPAADRYCCCMLIESGNAFYFIDAGAPVIDYCLRSGLDLKKFRCIFTTHAHGDHTNGLVHFIDLFNWYYKDCKGEFYLTDEVYLDAVRDMVGILDNHRTMDLERLQLKLVQPGLMYEDENIRVEYIPTKHFDCGLPSYSILVTEGDRKVLFSGDYSAKLCEKDIPEIVFEQELDTFICEMAHFGVADIALYLEKCKAKNVYFTHVFPLEKYDDIEAVKNSYPFEIHTPKDNDSFEL